MLEANDCALTPKLKRYPFTLACEQALGVEGGGGEVKGACSQVTSATGHVLLAIKLPLSLSNQPCIWFYVLFNIVDSDLDKDPAQLCCCLSKRSSDSCHATGDMFRFWRDLNIKQKSKYIMKPKPVCRGSDNQSISLLCCLLYSLCAGV